MRLRPSGKGPEFIVPTVSDQTFLSWESQASQYPQQGPPGITYLRGQASPTYYVDCLLYRDEDGGLLGILNHYPIEIPKYQREGSVNIWVHPAHRRSGVGRALIAEAVERWEIRRHGQDLTESGAELVEDTILRVFSSLQWWR